MTMVEVLVAAAVLMIGVWAVAQGFPTLLANITGEQHRTQAARLADAKINNLRQSPGSLPDAVRGLVPTTASIDPTSKPKDPFVTTNPLNSRDDIYQVEGQMAKVPAPAPGSSYALMPVSMGLLNTSDPGVTVYTVESLTRMPYPPDSPATNAPPGYFYLNASGTLFIPAGYDGARLDYVWVDSTSVSHWVEGERLLRANQSPAVQTLLVQPAWRKSQTPSFGFTAALSQPSRCWGFRKLTLLDPGDDPDLPGQVAVEPNFGGGLIFNRADSGKTVLIDYTLRLVHGKRDQYLIEDHTLGESISQIDNTGPTPDPDHRIVTVQLGWGGLDKLFPDAYVLAVDLQNGLEYYSDDTSGNVMLPPTPDNLRSGQVVLEVPTTSIGHLVRFYYKTTNDAMLSVYKPPTDFIDAATAAASDSAANEAWRTYSTSLAGGYTLLQFSLSNLGYTVAVDYVHYDTGVNRLVTGELHTLGSDSSGQHAICRLNRSGVIEIRAIHGVSLRARSWWISPSGLLRHYDVDTILPVSGAM
jgi:type II secretory pathway pseudopilin PulG